MVKSKTPHLSASAPAISSHSTPLSPQTIPRRRIRTHESPRDARATQAPAGATDHGQIGAQYPGGIAAGGSATPEGVSGAKTRDAWGRTLDRKPHAKTREDAVATVIAANRELTPPSHPPSFPPPNLPTPARHLSALRSGTPDRSPADAPEFIQGVARLGLPDTALRIDKARVGCVDRRGFMGCWRHELLQYRPHHSSRRG